MGRRATIYDVAERAGVSASTVSRAFARPGRVSSDTAARIFAAAKELGYRAAALPGLAGTHTRALALVVTDITNPFYSEIIRGAHDAATELGYTILIAHTQEDSRLERQWTERQLGAVEGVLLASSRMSDSAIRMMAKQKPVIVLNRRLPEVPCIITDNARGTRRAVEHLATLGHESISYVAGPESSWADGVRWQALREAAYELELKVRRLGPTNTPTIQAGFGWAREVVELHSTAVLAYNDMVAIGVLKGLRRLGVTVPDDISVVGFDNTLLAEVVEPELTTVAAPLQPMGSTAVRNIVAMIGGAVPSREPIVLPARLIERQSTAHRSRKRTSPAFGTTNVPPSASAATSMESRST